MTIEFLRGPMVGTTERVVEQIEEKGVPVYITETGKELSSIELNKLFRIKSDEMISNINFADLGDPSLAEIESDHFASTKTKEPKVKEAPNLKEPKSKLNPLIEQLFKAAKKESKRVDINFNIVIPTVDFYNLVNSAIEISDDELVDRIMDDVDIKEVKQKIRNEIISKYKKSTKSKKLDLELRDKPKPPESKKAKEDHIPKRKTE